MELRLNQARSEDLKYRAAYKNFISALEPYESRISSLSLADEEILRVEETSHSPSSKITVKVTVKQTKEGLALTLDEKLNFSVPISFPNHPGSADLIDGGIWDNYLLVLMLDHEINSVVFSLDRSKLVLTARGKKNTCLSILETPKWIDERIATPEVVTDKETIIDVLKKLTKVLTP